MFQISGNAMFLGDGWGGSHGGQTVPGPRLAPKPRNFPKKLKIALKCSQKYLEVVMKTSMPRQVLIFKKSMFSVKTVPFE